MNKDSRDFNSAQSTERHLAALPQIDRVTGRLFSGLIAVIAVGFVVILACAAYRYFQTP